MNRPWDTMDRGRIEVEINRFKHDKEDNIANYINEIEKWSENLKSLIPKFHEIIENKAKQLVQDMGDECFKEYAKNHAISNFLFPSYNKRLSLDSILKKCSMPKKPLN
ncbi:hypothetical protein Bccel_3423 [Pseudobacteroides cellulosolvens ATCC 35603 = DSM 2933]|uniref:Uncharacterized protein n=2 Tax=Pseudobacteroides cellulosolvens TaxID=35825 RepID=A0A0L6JRY4_9FIRM|nr:hypothetical protein Bccel_3423 [Pseudobacteroides cellulosolvens ATCC 35603 = DSM 2933]